MPRFYKVAITKQPIGSAIEHREPAVQGEIIIKVTDATTAGDYKLVVVEANDDQHQMNLALPGVEELAENEAVKLAKRYQPKRTLTRLNPQTGQEEEVTLPAVDLKKFYQKQE